MKRIFITAAPVGAVPRYVNPVEPKFIPASLLDDLLAEPRRGVSKSSLLADGWQQVEAGGLGFNENAQLEVRAVRESDDTFALQSKLAEEGWRLAEDGMLRLNDKASAGRASPIVSRRSLLALTDQKIVRSLVLCLTGQGWVADETGDLSWPHGLVETYLPSDLVAEIRDSDDHVLQALLASGWTWRGAGYWRSVQSCSPFLPITPDAIVAESLDAVREGAAIVHLHTRDLASDRDAEVPGLGALIRVGKQANYIDLSQYDHVVPRLQALAPSAILNLSTSVRGGKADSESPRRRSHLKPYGSREQVPEISSLSPGAVLFQAGGGYDNSPEFLSAQLAHCKELGIRPEVEVFNRKILNSTLGSYLPALAEAGAPALLMLVVGVDQYRTSSDGAVQDDSLIPVDERKNVFRLIDSGARNAIDEAVRLVVDRLRPVIDRIRTSSPTAKISALMPGPMQLILARVAVDLDLDGVRVGLEDALNVTDDRVPGGIRRGTTAEQVRQIRGELESRGVTVTSAEDARDALGLPRAEVALFRAAVTALAGLPLLPADGVLRPISSNVLGALASLRPIYTGMETRFVAALTAQERTLPGSASAVADLTISAVREHGLYVRYFVEERDRYPSAGATAFKEIYRLQALNFTRELLSERGVSTAAWDAALQGLARDVQLHEAAYTVSQEQFKGQALRFLEFLASVPCRYSEDRVEVVNVADRAAPAYSGTMALLFEAINELTLALRATSSAELKAPGICIYRDGRSGAELAGDSGVSSKNLSGAEVGEAIDKGAWIVLPSTPTTNYWEGLKLSKGLTSTFASFLNGVVSNLSEDALRQQDHPTVLGIAHSGLDSRGNPLIESNMLQNRFSLNTDAHETIVAYSPRLIYEACLLPRLVERPELLQWLPSGLVARDHSGAPIYIAGGRAKRLSFQGIDDLSIVKFLAHSSGIATIQQMDNAMRQDLTSLGYSVQEQEEVFGRSVVLSFASACDVNVDVLGTPVVDVTAYNDIRSLAGTTTLDYLLTSTEDRKALAELIRSGARAGDFRYERSRWILRKGRNKKVLLRRVGVFLKEDPVRLHDGHSIRRYLEGTPREIRDLFVRLQSAHRTARMDLLLRQYFGEISSRWKGEVSSVELAG